MAVGRHRGVDALDGRSAATMSGGAMLRAIFRAIAVNAAGTRMVVSIMESGVVCLALPPGFDDPAIRRVNTRNGVSLVITPPDPPAGTARPRDDEEPRPRPHHRPRKNRGQV